MTSEKPYRRVFVNARGAGRRADVFLSLRFSDWSRSQFCKFIREGLILSDDRTLKPSSTLKEGEVLRVFVPGIAPSQVAPPLPPILLEDDCLLAFNKPPGMLTHAVGQRWEWALIGLARDARPDAEVDLVHRIDRDTSGVLLMAKGAEANRIMKGVFKDRKVSKSYLALVRGVVPWDTHTEDGPIGKPAGAEIELRRGVVPDGEHACTRFEVVQRLDGLTLVHCKPVTGRTHQIRVHLEHAGFPILGDKIYGQPDAVFLEYLQGGATDGVRTAVGFPRQCLHAHTLTFPHPRSGQAVRIVAPLPPDMQRVVDGAPPSWEMEGETAQNIETEEEEEG